MTDFLIRKFIKNYEDTENNAVRTQYGKFSSFVGILCNIMLFGGKFVAGLLSGSVSIMADAVNNLSDASSSIISLLGFKLAERPADAEHPYGHGRYEYLSGMLVAVIIILIGFELLKSSFDKVLHPEPVEFNLVSIGILAASILVKLWMMMFNRRIGNKISSSTLIATAADSRNDVISTSAVLVAGLISRFTNLELDGWMGLAVAIFILISGYGLIKDTMNPVLGSAPDESMVKAIRDKIMSYPNVLGTHDLIIHDYGPGRKFASVHVEMAAEGDVIENHDIIDNIEQDFLQNDGLHVVIHMDPIVTGDGQTNDLRIWISDEIKVIDPRLTIHDLRIVPGVTHTNVVFDCVRPIELDMTDGELKAAVGALVKRQYPNYNCVITVDRSYAAMPH